MTTGSPSYQSSSPPPGTSFGQYLSFLTKTSAANPYLNLGAWSISSNSYTIACWINVRNYPTSGTPAYTIVTKGTSTISWQLAVVNIPAKLKFTAGVSTGGNQNYVSSNSVTPNLWLPTVLVFDDMSKQLRMYLNGTKTTRSLTAAQSAYEDGASVFVGYSADVFVDELYFFNYAFSDAQASAWAARTTGYSLPSLTMPSNQVVPIGSPGRLNATATSAGNPINYEWSVSGSCITANFSAPNAATTDVTINGEVFATYTVGLKVSDAVSTLCTTGTVDVSLSGTQPNYNIEESSYPTSGELQVPLGATASMTVVLTGSPAPRIKWQELVDVAISGGQRSYWSGMRHPLDERGVDLDWVFERAVATLRACNSSANVTKDCSEWLDIAGQTSITYTTPIGNSTLNGTQVRFVASNAKGTFFSDPVVLLVSPGSIINNVSSSSSSGGDGGTDNTGVIIGPIVGVVGGCLVLCCLLLLLTVLIVLLRRRQKSNEFPGIPPDFEQVIFGQYLSPMYKVKSKQNAALQKLESLLTSSNDYDLLLALGAACKKSRSENMARALVYILHAHGKCGSALEALLATSIATTEEQATLFRANSIDTQMFKYFAILTSAPYLWDVLAGFIWEIQQDAIAIAEAAGEDVELGRISSSRSLRSARSGPGSKRASRSCTLNNMGMEIDPTKMDEASDPKINTLQLWLTAQKIFTTISRSTDVLPSELADLLVFVFHEVEKKFSGEEYKAMGGFLFLRFICPSLLAPHLYGLIEEPPLPNAQRQYILIGKVLQNLANNTLPGNKEEYMQRLNEFITNNQEDLRSFYDKILAAQHLSASSQSISDSVKKNALAEVYSILLSCQDRIDEALNKYYSPDDPIHQDLKEILSAGPIDSVS